MVDGKPELTTVTIDGTTVDSYLISWKKDSKNFDNSPVGVQIVLSKAAENVLTFTESLVSKSVIIQRGISLATEEYVFKGQVHNFSIEGGKVIIICYDKLALLSKLTITTSFDSNVGTEAGVISEIFKTIVNDYSDLTADNTSVTNSGTDNILSKFVCRSVSILNRLQALAESLGWRIYYNPSDDLIYFGPYGILNQSTELSTSSNIKNQPKWVYNTDNHYNMIELRGARQTFETIESGQIGVTNGYTTTSVQLSFTPVSIKIYSDSSNPPTTLLTGGIEKSSSSFDYNVDVEQKKVLWNDTYSPGASDYVKIEYSYEVPTPVIAPDIDSIEKYDEKKITIFRNDIVNVDDAELYATQYLEDHKDPIESTSLKITNVSDLQVGQSVSVTDEFSNITGTYIIQSIKQSYPYNYDTITVTSNIQGNSDYIFEISKRVKRLETENVGDTDLLLHVLPFSRDVIYERRDIQLIKENVVGDTLVWGSSLYGILGTYKWGSVSGAGFIIGNSTFGVLGTGTLGDSSGSASETVMIIPGTVNGYVELFYDDDYKDTSMTADWNTTTKELTISSGEVAQSSSIWLNAKTITRAQLTITGTNTSNATLYMTADGGDNWEEVTNGNYYNFLNVGADLRYKITNDGSDVIVDKITLIA